jgi:hypothetical protein
MWSGVDAGVVEDVPHGGGGHLVVEVGEFAVDASVAPFRVLGGMRKTRALTAAAVGGRPGRRRWL